MERTGVDCDIRLARGGRVGTTAVPDVIGLRARNDGAVPT